MSTLTPCWTEQKIRDFYHAVGIRLSANFDNIKIEFSSAKNNHATIYTKQRRIRFSTRFLNSPDTPEAMVYNTMLHELAHLIVEDAGLESVYSDFRPHGAAWKDVCGILGVLPRATSSGKYFPNITRWEALSMQRARHLPKTDLNLRLEELKKNRRAGA